MYRATRKKTHFKSSRVRQSMGAAGHTSYSKFSQTFNNKLYNLDKGYGVRYMYCENTWKPSSADNNQIADEYNFIQATQNVAVPYGTTGRYDTLDTFQNLLAGAPSNNPPPAASQGYVMKKHTLKYHMTNVTLEDQLVQIMFFRCKDNVLGDDKCGSLAALWDQMILNRGTAPAGFAAVTKNTIGQKLPYKSETIRNNWKLVGMKKFSLSPGAQHVGSFVTNFNKSLSLEDTSTWNSAATRQVLIYAKGWSLKMFVIARSMPMSQTADITKIGIPGTKLDFFFTQWFSGVHVDNNTTVITKIVNAVDTPAAGPYTMVDQDGDQTIAYATA